MMFAGAAKFEKGFHGLIMFLIGKTCFIHPGRFAFLGPTLRDSEFIMGLGSGAEEIFFFLLSLFLHHQSPNEL